MKEEIMDAAVALEAEPKIGPGRDLRAAREARNLSPEAVATQLRIHVAQVRALEDDDYDKFAAPIFVTGYLRAYARLLGLAPEPLIEAYQSLGVAAVPSLERVAHLNHQPEPVSRAQVPRWLVMVLAAAVVVTVVVVWRSEASKILLPIMESPLPEKSFSANTGDGAITATVPVPENNVAAASPPEQSTAEPAAQGTAEPAAQGTAEPAAVKAPSVPAGNGSPATLALKADKPSWVEVKDRGGNRLFYDLMVPGDVQRLEGTPPFDVLLGYAPGVNVEYNGKQVDHTAYARQGMARFRVGDNGTSNN